MPDGKAKETVAAVCANCHEFFSRVGAGYTPEGWRTVMRIMLNQGAPVPEDQLEAVTEYLISAFPEKPKPTGAIIPGPAEINIKMWPVPTPGSRPHDPLAASDGSIWYTGQLANVLGRLDPKTGAFKEYPLKTPHSGPHGLVEDREGNIWYTGNAAGLIGKLDPKTGEVTEYSMPDPAARDPHTLVFDHSGIIWFSVQNANMVGRLDPKSGDIKLVTTPTAGARPYGLAVDSKGIPFFVAFGAPKVGSIDPATLAIREYPLPDPGARPRRIAITSDDAVWYTDFARGYLGLLDPTTGIETIIASGGSRGDYVAPDITNGTLFLTQSESALRLSCGEGCGIGVTPPPVICNTSASRPAFVFETVPAYDTVGLPPMT